MYNEENIPENIKFWLDRIRTATLSINRAERMLELSNEGIDKKFWEESKKRWKDMEITFINCLVNDIKKEG